MSRLSWRSIEVELPLSIFVFLVLVIGILSSSAYYEMRSSRLVNASERLETVTAELATLTVNSVTQRIEQAVELADDHRIHDYLDGTGSGAAVRAFLDSVANDSPNAASVELRSSLGEDLISSDATLDTEVERTVRYSGSEPFVGPLLATDDGMVTETVAPVFDRDSAVHGYLVYRRHTQSAEAVRELMSQLIGGDALLLVGNQDGEVWTDMVGMVEGPPRHLLQDSVARPYQRDSSIERLGAAASVEGAPWVIVVEYPMSTVMAPVRAFLTRLLLTSLALVFVGGLGAWLVSRRITWRLGRATRAAEAVAAGQFDQRIDDERPDELGGLARAFNTMADAVEDGRRQLEDKVDTRTRELHTALDDLRSTQEVLVRNERLAVLGQLSSGLGHELRNPLGVMSNAVYFLNAVTGGDDPRVTRYLTIIRDQIGLSEKIVGDLLDYARVREPTVSDFSLAEVAKAQLERIAPPPNVTTQVNIPDDLTVHGDPVQLGQAIFNLLSNACQAMERSEAPELTVTAAEGCGDRVELVVRDTGCGIPEDRLEEIFEPLFTTRARGIGLGLALTRAYVKANGGEIKVKSRVDEGTTFAILIPAVEAEVAA